MLSKLILIKNIEVYAGNSLFITRSDGICVTERKLEHKRLHIIHIGVVTNQSGQTRFPDLIQLLLGESSIGVAP